MVKYTKWNATISCVRVLESRFFCLPREPRTMLCIMGTTYSILHKQLLAKLDNDVYSEEHAVCDWYQPRTAKDNAYEATSDGQMELAGTVL